MHFPPHMVVALARAVSALRECDQLDEAEELLGAIDACKYLEGRPPEPPAPPPPPPKPKTRSKMTDEERRAWNAERKRIERAKKPVASGATNQCDNGATNGATSVRHLVRQNRDLARASDRLNSLVSSASYPEKNPEREGENARALVRQTGATNGATFGATSATHQILKRMQDRLCAFWDHESYEHSLGKIAARPEAEFAKVLASLAADPWIREKPARATPDHVIKYWGKYLTPEPPKRARVDEEKPPPYAFRTDPALHRQMLDDFAAEEGRKVNRG